MNKTKILEIKEINNELGNADLFLIDQILKGRFNKEMKILECGCGEGRNMVYFIRNGYNIFGLDQDENAVRMARFVSSTLNREYRKTSIIHTQLDNTGLPDDFFDFILCLNVLHFSDSLKAFYHTFDEIYRILIPGGSIMMSMESMNMMKPAMKIKDGIYKSQEGESRLLFTQELESEILRKYHFEEGNVSIDLKAGNEKNISYRFWRKSVN